MFTTRTALALAFSFSAVGLTSLAELMPQAQPAVVHIHAPAGPLTGELTLEQAEGGHPTSQVVDRVACAQPDALDLDVDPLSAVERSALERFVRADAPAPRDADRMAELAWAVDRAEMAGDAPRGRLDVAVEVRGGRLVAAQVRGPAATPAVRELVERRAVLWAGELDDGRYAHALVVH